MASNYLIVIIRRVVHVACLQETIGEQVCDFLDFECFLFGYHMD